MGYDRLRCSLVKVAVAKQTRKSFLVELVKVDPLMEKVAANWEPTGMSAPVPKKGGLAGAGRRGLEWVKKNPWKAADYGLTALSLYPPARIAGAGLKAYRLRRAGNLLRKANPRKAEAYRRLSNKTFRSMNPLSRGAFAGGGHVPGQFTNLGKGGRLWGENWDKLKWLRSPDFGSSWLTGKARQAIRLGTVGFEGLGLHQMAKGLTKSVKKRIKGNRLRESPPPVHEGPWRKHPRSHDKQKIMPYPTGAYRQGKKLRDGALRASPPPVHRGPWEKSPRNTLNR